MPKFLLSVGIALISVVGLMVAIAGLIIFNIPRPNDIKGCLTTKMYKVRLCPGESGYVRLQNISPHLRNAVIVSEDAAFYGHNGFDFHELRQSFQTNLKEGRFARGGSTITQQLAKNVYLTAEKSLLRKFKEALIAIQLEDILTKDEILEKYLNVVEFGPKVYGIKTAAQYYFSKSPASLSPTESAFLAFLLPNPKKYSVSFQKKEMTPFARKQTREIVTRLYKFKRISELEYQTSIAEVDFLFGGAPVFGSDELGEPLPEEMGEEGDEEVGSDQITFSEPESPSFQPEETSVEIKTESDFESDSVEIDQ